MKHLFYKTRQKLTFDETKEVLTPFAFKMDPSLFGLPIARPFKRGLAISIDLLLIAILSSAGGEFLAIALAILAFRMGRKKDIEEFNAKGKVKGRKRRYLLRLLGAFILFLVLIEVLAPMVNSVMDDPADDSGHSITAGDYAKEYGSEFSNEVKIAKALQVAGFILTTTTKASEAQCQDTQCWQQVFSELPEQLQLLEFSDSESDKIIEEVVGKFEFDSVMKAELLESLKAENALYRQQLLQSPNETSAPATDSPNNSDVNQDIASLNSEQTPVRIPSDTSQITKDKEQEIEDSTSNDTANDEKPSKPIYSFMELIKGIIDDLGLGFGWAAFYFTVFTSVWNGKTPGKKMLGIKVIQLDGTHLSIWDSFGRYGGYGAGIATGLLGFLQIYWDPNRQAIHDQISATVVIDEKRTVDPELIAKAKQKSDQFISEHTLDKNSDESLDSIELPKESDQKSPLGG